MYRWAEKNDKQAVMALWAKDFEIVLNKLKIKSYFLANGDACLKR
jgi:hypothetical protein